MVQPLGLWAIKPVFRHSRGLCQKMTTRLMQSPKLRYHNWTWIGIITTDGDNGCYAADWLEVHASSKQIFVSYRVVLPDFLNDECLDCKLNEAIKLIESTSKVQDIESFSKPHHMSCLFKKLTPNASGRHLFSKNLPWRLRYPTLWGKQVICCYSMLNQIINIQQLKYIVIFSS